MQMMSKIKLTPKELETGITTVITANWSIDTAEEAIVHMKDLDMFVTVKLFEDTPAELSPPGNSAKKCIPTNGKQVKHRILLRKAKLHIANGTWSIKENTHYKLSSRVSC